MIAQMSPLSIIGKFLAVKEGRSVNYIKLDKIVNISTSKDYDSDKEIRCWVYTSNNKHSAYFILTQKELEEIIRGIK